MFPLNHNLIIQIILFNPSYSLILQYVIHRPSREIRELPEFEHAYLNILSEAYDPISFLNFRSLDHIVSYFPVVFSLSTISNRHVFQLTPVGI